MANEYITGRTCVSCVRGNLSSFLEQCVECLKKGGPGNRFPNWESKDEQTARKLD